MTYKEIIKFIIQNNLEFIAIQDSLQSIKNKEKETMNFIIDREKEIFKQNFLKDSKEIKKQKRKVKENERS